MRFIAARTSLGIYITPVVIELVELHFSKDGFKIKKAAHIPTPPHSITEDGKIVDPRPIGLLLQETLKAQKFPRAKARIALWGTGVFAHLIKLPPLERDEMREALISEAERYAVFAESEPVVDFEVLTPSYIGPTQQTVDVFFSAAQRELTTAYHEILKLAKLPLAGFDYAPLSILRTHYALDNIGTAQEENQLWGAVAIMPRKAVLSVWQGSLLKFYREIDIPMAATEGGISLNFVHLDQAFSHQELIQDILNSLDYFKSMNPENQVAKLYLTMEASSKEAANAFAKELERMGKVKAICLEGSLVAGGMPQQLSLSPITVGGAASGKVFFPKSFDLIHPESKPLELTREFKLQVASSMVLILLVGFYYLYSLGAIENKKRQMVLNQQLLASLQLQVDDPQLALKVRLLEEIEKLTRYPIDELFSTAQRRIPQDTWLNTLNVKRDGKFSLTGGTLSDRSPLEYGRNLVLFPDISTLELVNVTEAKEGEKSFYVYGFTGQLKPRKLE